jgi:hypothetical protein
MTGRFMQILTHLANKHFLGVVLITLVLRIAFQGLWIAQDKVYLRLARNPWTMRTDMPKVNYFQESVVLPVLANVTGMTTNIRYHALCVSILAIGLVAFIIYMRREGNALYALLFWLLLLAHPVLNVLFNWIGLPDCVTFALMVFLLFTRSPVAILFLFLIGVLNHQVFIYSGLSLLIVRYCSRTDGLSIRHGVCALTGIILGIITLHSFLWLNGIAINSSRYDCAMSWQLGDLVQRNFVVLQMLLFSFHGMVWLAGILALWSVKHDRVYALGFIASQIIAYGISFFTSDSTRIFCLLAWAPMIHLLRHALAQASDKENDRSRTELLLLYAVIGVAAVFIAPHYSVWGGVIYPPRWVKFYGLLFKVVHVQISL